MISGNPNPWAPLASSSPVALTRHPLALQSLLLTVLLISPLQANSYIRCFYIQESWVKGPTTKAHYIAQANCQLAGCQSGITIPIPDSKSKINPGQQGGPALCFLHNQSAGMQVNPRRSFSRHPNGTLALNIPDPWNKRWNVGVWAKVYKYHTYSNPQGMWLIFRFYTRIVPEAIEHLNSQPPFSRSSPQVRIQPVAIPHRARTTLTDIPLFKVHSQNFSLCYKTASSFSFSCNTTVKVKSSLYAPPGEYFWCNGTSTKVINASFPFPCVAVTLVLQLEVYGQAEVLSLLPPSPNHRDRRAVFLPMVISLSLASSLVAAGLGSSALGYSVTSATQLENKLHVAIKASAASLQRQITSLAQQEVARKKQCPISSKGSDRKAGCLAGRPDTPTSAPRA
ncbi:Endogenous retrovirus group FC1 Env polyprotein [Plecturocebus cupreus]